MLWFVQCTHCTTYQQMVVRQQQNTLDQHFVSFCGSNFVSYPQPVIVLFCVCLYTCTCMYGLFICSHKLQKGHYLSRYRQLGWTHLLHHLAAGGSRATTRHTWPTFSFVLSSVLVSYPQLVGVLLVLVHVWSVHMHTCLSTQVTKKYFVNEALAGWCLSGVGIA